MKKKKLVTLALTAAMTGTLLAGCGSSAGTTRQSGAAASASSAVSAASAASTETASASESGDSGEASLPDLDTSKEVELVMYVVSDRPAGQDIVDENMNKIFREKLNCTLKINWIGWAEFKQKYPMLYSSGEKFDMAYCATWLNFTNLARKGAFRELNDLLPKYAPDNYAMQSQTALNQASIDGKLYAVPTLLPTYSAKGAIYRGDIADEAGITDTIDTFDEVEKYCDYVVANHPEMEPIDIYSSGPDLSYMYAFSKGYMSISNALFFDTNDASSKVTPIYDIDGMTDFYNKMKEWGDKGYWTKSALSDTDSTKFQNGKAALRFHNIDTYREQYVLHPDWNIHFGTFNQNVAHLPYTQDCMVISNTSENPERALALWNLLTTDQEAYDAFYYGILGTTYDLNDKGEYTILDTDLYNTNAMWAVRTKDLNRNQAGTPDDYNTIRDEWEKEIDPKKGEEQYGSFVLDTSSITTEIAACTSANQQYEWPLQLGYTNDVNASIQEYKDAIKAAGEDKVIEECQRQLDAYRSANGIQ